LIERSAVGRSHQTFTGDEEVNTASKTAATLAAVTAIAGAASAQPFVHSIGGPEVGEERYLDLTTVSADAILAAGGFNFPTPPGAAPVTEGYIVLHDQAGSPIIGWLADTQLQREEAVAIRVDPADDNFLIMQRGVGNDFVLWELDPNTGGFNFAVRYASSLGADLGVPGMEVDTFDPQGLGRVSGLVAASFDSPQNLQQPTLLRFDTSNGFPVFYNTYQIFFESPTKAKFLDVTPDEDGNVYAVGTVNLSFQGLSAGSKVFVARFDFFGNPVWIRAYDAQLDGPGDRNVEGYSIEITQNGDIGVTAAVGPDPLLGPASMLYLTLDPAGNPLDANYINFANGAMILAQSSLETLPNDPLLLTGARYESPTGDALSVMFAIDASTATPAWAYAPDEIARGFTNTVTVQDNIGPIAGGSGTPRNNPSLGGVTDALLHRARFGGEGLCPSEVPFDIFPPEVITVDLFAEVIQLDAIETGLEVTPVEPKLLVNCDQQAPCPGDFDGDGLRGTSDLLILLANWGMPGGPAQGDADNDGFVGTSDLLILLANWGVPCP
jgi:hypothetical protein